MDLFAHGMAGHPIMSGTMREFAVGQKKMRVLARDDHELAWTFVDCPYIRELVGRVFGDQRTDRPTKDDWGKASKYR